MRNDVIVIVGSGGMGVAIAHRLGSGRTVVLSDMNSDYLDAATRALVANGHDVHATTVDVTSPLSVSDLAAYAAGLGPVTDVVHTVGVSPEHADIDTVLRVDLVGVALVLERFGEVIEVGGAGVVIASMAGHFHPAMDAGLEHQLAGTPAGELLAIPACAPALFRNSQEAYSFAKRANHLRVAAAAVAWGRRGARINSISPGIISTALGMQELNGSSGTVMKAMIDGSAAGRIGTPDDIAAAVEFLLSPAASFITGADLVVDGGITGAVKAGMPVF
ncbi:SDR family oxidoreductase [Mycobacterium sp.]|uniref:SDR family oxidoreductase n=1 Tax=Mycobacterium sp. TaxID=1785 RepID=UPI003F9A5C61